MRHWTAWSGTIEDIRRIANILSNLEDTRRTRIEAEVDEPKDAITVRREARARFEPFTCMIEIEDGDNRISGPVDMILSEIDNRTTRNISFGLPGVEHYGRIDSPFYDDNITIEFISDHPYNNLGTDLKVTTSDQGWGRQAFAQLSEEIEKGVPRWAWIHKRLGIASIFILTYIALLTFLFLVLPPFPEHLSDKSNPNHLATVVSWAVLATVLPILGAVATASRKLRTWAFPTFEILGVHGASTGSRRIAYIVGILISIPIGIFVNLIS